VGASFGLCAPFRMEGNTSLRRCVFATWLSAHLHMFAILFYWIFATTRYPGVWSVGCGQILPYVLVLFTLGMNERKGFNACKIICPQPLSEACSLFEGRKSALPHILRSKEKNWKEHEGYFKKSINCTDKRPKLWPADPASPLHRSAGRYPIL
jgi:hypothetical protein